MAGELFVDKKAAGGLTELITGGAAPAQADDVEIGGRINVAADAPREERTAPGDAPAGMKLGLVAPQAPVEVAQLPPVPLNDAYAARAARRESAALDQEAAEVQERSAWEKAQAVGADISKGIVLEGGQALLSGGKRGLNSALDLIDESGDYLTNKFGGPGTDTEGNFRWFKPGEWDEMEAAAKAKGQSNAADFFGGNRVATNEKERPTTVTGHVIEGGAQFTTGMLLGGRVLRGWNVATKGGFILKALAQGGIADFTAFDGNDARLSNLLENVAPEKAKPIFEYLAADDEDPELVGRAKNALEGAVLGLGVETAFAGLRQIKAARQAKAAAKAQALKEGGQVPVDLAAEATRAAGEKTQRDLVDVLGDPAEELVKEGRSFKQKQATAAMRVGAKGGVSSETVDQVIDATVEPNAFDINFSRIEAPEDVQAVISTMAEKYAGDVDAARRGIRSWEETRKAAGETDWVASMAARRKGDALNAETVLAYREAMNASATKLLDLARAVKEEPTLANQFAFRKMMATHHAIQMEFMGARAEAGRALNAFKIPAGTPERSLRQIDALLADSGGANASRALADKVLEAAAKGDVTLNEFTKAGAMARSRAMIRLIYTNSLLSSVGTSVVNVGGNTLAIAMNVASRAASPRLARALGDDSVTQIGEASALVAGYMNAVRDAMRLAPHQTLQKVTEDGGRYLRQEGVFRGMAPGLDDAMPPGIQLRPGREEAGAALGEQIDTKPLSAASWRVDEDSTLGRTLDVLQMVVESPSNANSLMDDFFKVVAARGELHAQAFRQSQRELSEGLLDGAEAVKARMKEMLENPTDEMLSAAEQEMHDLTFTRQTPGAAQAFSKLRAALDARGPVPVGTIMLPFLRTPANLISKGVRYSPLAPFMRRYADDIAEGGAKAEIAKAQWAIGTALWSVWLGMAADGQLTGNGPGNPAQKQAMMRQDEFGGALWQPYSVKMGDRWYSFERADPIGTSLSLAADMGELLANNDWDDEQAEDLTDISSHSIAALGQAFFDKTALKSALEVTAAMISGDPTQAELLLKSRASGAVPGSAALRMFRRGDDEYLRETHNVLTALKNTIPGLSEELPIQRDLWGRPRTYQTGLGTVYDAIVPVQTKAAGGTAIDLEILNNGVTVSMPQRSLSVAGESVSLKNRPDIYSEFVRRAGEPAFQHLEAVVTGNHPDSEFYLSLSDGPDGGKAEYIKDVIRAYKDRARAEIMDIYASDLEAMAADRIKRREEARANGDGY